MLEFSTDKTISAAEFRDLLIRSTLAERRPVEDEACLEGMLSHSDLLVTCWDGSLLVGVARSVTDFHWCCYLSDLAVDTNYQRRGIGCRLMELMQGRLREKCKLILLSAPAATEYYPKVGFERHNSAWILPRNQAVRHSPNFMPSENAGDC